MDELTLQAVLAENQALKRELARLTTATGSRPAPAEGSPAVGNLLKLVEKKNEQLESSYRELEDANHRLEQAYQRTLRYYVSTVRAMAAAIESGTPSFRGHSASVAQLARQTAGAMGLDAATVAQAELAGLLHDFGNIAVSHEILEKPGALSAEERTAMQQHTTAAALILEPIGDLGAVIAAIRSHHERWDGTGYPDAKAGDGIPVVARILAAADAWDAMTHPRPWRSARTEPDALAELRKGSGGHFDPAVVNALTAVLRPGGGR